MSNYRGNNMYRQQRNPHGNMQPLPASCNPCRDDNMEGMAIAMAYVPWQEWREVYDPKKGLSRGTIFKELDKPFLGKGVMKR